MPWVELLPHLLFSAIGTLLICLAGFLLVLFFWRVLRVKADREHSVSLENKGNCRSIYYLEVKSPEPAIGFALLYNKLPLAPVYLPTEADEVVETQFTKNLPQKVEQSENKPSSASSSGVNTAAKAGKSLSSVAGKSASILEQIGNLLPGSMGSKLKQQAGSARTAQTSAMRTSRAPQMLQRQVSGFQPKGAGKKIPLTPGKPPSPRESASAAPEKVLSTRRSKARRPGESCFVQTPVVEPGQALNLSLRIGTHRRHYPRGSFPYTIEILPVPVDFPDLTATSSLQNGTVHFNPVGAWRYFLPAFSTVTLILMTLTALVFLYRFIWL